MGCLESSDHQARNQAALHTFKQIFVVLSSPTAYLELLCQPTIEDCQLVIVVKILYQCQIPPQSHSEHTHSLKVHIEFHKLDFTKEIHLHLLP